MAEVLTYAAPAADRREMLRYAGVREATGEIETLLEDCLAELWDMLTYRVCYRILPRWEFGEMVEQSATASRFLRDAEKLLLFGATVGLAPDRLMLRYGDLSPAKALMIQAIATERIEALCDIFCADMEKRLDVRLGQRFSPGYGDLPLAFQTRVFDLLSCEKTIGVTLNESLLMSPTKSVTALMGILEE